MTDAFGNTITFTKIKLILVVIDSPNGTKNIQIGPGAVTNPFDGPFNGTNPTEDVYEFYCNAFPDGGWTVTAGTGDQLRVSNNSGVSVDYHILLVGVGS